MEKELLKMEEEGFTTRFAVHYLHTKEEEKKNTHFSKELIERAHNNGFYADNYFKYTDNEKNSINNKAYLSDYDYEKLWPLNDWMRIWVNDKLTFEYIGLIDQA